MAPPMGEVVNYRWAHTVPGHLTKPMTTPGRGGGVRRTFIKKGGYPHSSNCVMSFVNGPLKICVLGLVKKLKTKQSQNKRLVVGS